MLSEDFSSLSACDLDALVNAALEGEKHEKFDFLNSSIFDDREL